MRALSDIDADITAAALRLEALRAEREEARQALIDDICRRFDAGVHIKIIARAAGLPKSSVQGILWRAGRTQTGRRNARARIRDHVAQGAAA